MNNNNTGQKKPIFYLIVFAILLLVSNLAAGIAGYQKSRLEIIKGRGENRAADFKPFFKSIHYFVGIEGKLTQKGERWIIENQGDQIAVLIPPSTELYKGKAFSADDYANWQKISPEQVNAGDYLIAPGFYNPDNNYVTPRMVFIKIQ